MLSAAYWLRCCDSQLRPRGGLSASRGLSAVCNSLAILLELFARGLQQLICRDIKVAALQKNLYKGTGRGNNFVQGPAIH